MLFLPNDQMFPNVFVDVELPTKKQIFARTGQVAVNPAGVYSGEDNPVAFSSTPTQSADAFVKGIEADEAEKSSNSKK